jgi:hypothetical protein
MNWTEALVAERFEACVQTLRKLPPVRVGGYVSTWPDIVYSPQEINRQEPKPIRFTASPDEITRMEETLTWFPWVNEAERKLLWLRAERVPWRVIARKTGFPKTSAQRYWQVALRKIARRLEAERNAA